MSGPGGDRPRTACLHGVQPGVGKLRIVGEGLPVKVLIFIVRLAIVVATETAHLPHHRVRGEDVDTEPAVVQQLQL